MATEIIDRRVLRILRWSLIIHLFFLVQNSFSPGFYRSFRKLPREEILHPSAYIPTLIVVLLFILLSLKSVQTKITKPVFLFILYLLAITTIFSRSISGFFDVIGPQNKGGFIGGLRGEWDMVILLIIPLVFIAWQFSMRQVIFYCLSVAVIESIPLLLVDNIDVFLVILKTISNITRSVVLFIVGWIQHQLVKVQREQHDQLAEANKKLRTYALTNEKLAQTQERNRLARELHDTLAHTLSSVSVQLEATKALFERDPSGAKKMLNETLVNTKNGLKETRRTLVDLRSSELESYGLTQALRNLGTTVAARGGFKIELKLDKEMDMLADDVGHCLYRTAQESLENTLRHANAKHVSISLLSSGESVQLKVIDDGSGFDVEAVSQENLGVRGMRERVEMMGGTFSIESGKKTGTIVTATMEKIHDKSDNL